jgi:tetratricopeptide (TPR) repeat protein
MLTGASILLVALAAGGCADDPESRSGPGAGEVAAPAPGVEQVQPSIASPTPEQLIEAVRRDPDDPRARHALAVALYQAGRTDEALGHFERVAEIDPSALHLIELGAAYLSVARANDAETAFQGALGASPGHPIALHHLGNLAEARGDRVEAISLYRQAVENDPEYLIAHYHLAQALQQIGRLEDAYRSYENVVNLDPRSPPEVEAFDGALFQLASLDLRMGATERAAALLQVLVDAVPEHPEAHGMLARALTKLGRQEEARRELEIHERLAANRP